MNNKVRAVLEGVLERFKTGDIPQAITYAMYPVPNIPSSKWSFMNRLFMLMAGTMDARGIRQWNRAGRSVKKGAKALYILVPRIVKVKSVLKENLKDPEEEKVMLKGFMTQPVFRVQDTEGDPLDYETLPLPDLPLIEKAREWGISVSAVPPFSKAYGAYLSDAREILLASPEEIVFFHELSHAAHEKAIGGLKPGQVWSQEIVAELCAQVLCRLVNRNPQDNLGNTYRYIERQAQKAALAPLSACLEVIEDVRKVLALILDLEDGGGKDNRENPENTESQADRFAQSPSQTAIQ